jgi:hypothetical protein
VLQGSTTSVYHLSKTGFALVTEFTPVIGTFFKTSRCTNEASAQIKPFFSSQFHPKPAVAQPIMVSVR